MPNKEASEVLVNRLRLAGLDDASARRTVAGASDSELATLDRSLSQRLGGDDGEQNRLRTLDWVAHEYLRPYDTNALADTEPDPDDLSRDVSTLVEAAKLLRGVPASMYSRMWPVVSEELAGSAGYSYRSVSRALLELGIADALEVADHAVMRELEVADIPPIDLDLLRDVGYADPDWALRHIVRDARSAAARMERDRVALSSILEEASVHLQDAAAGRLAELHPPRPKRWAGFSKLLTGASIAGLNIVSGVALTAASGPLAPFAVGAGLPSVLASTAAGVGQIVEGVGALRGE